MSKPAGLVQGNIAAMADRIAYLLEQAESWFYRLAPLFVFSLIDDPAMLALAFC